MMIKQFSTRVARTIILFIINFSLFIILTTCSRANDPFEKDSIFILVTDYPSVGNTVFIDVSYDYVFTAENATGARIYNRINGTIHKEIDVFFFPGNYSVLQLRNTGLVKYIPDINCLFIWDRSDLPTRSQLYTYDFARQDYYTEIYGTNYAVLAATEVAYVINDIEFETHPEEGKVYTYWGGWDRWERVYQLHHKECMLTDDPERLPLTDIESKTIPNESFLITKTDDKIIAAMGELGVYIADKTSLERIDLIDTPGAALDVALANDYIYVADRHCGLQVIDYRDGTNGTLLPEAARSTSGHATTVTISGNYLALGSGSGGIYIYDISDPANPVFIERMLMSAVGYVNMVRFFDNELYVASRERGALRFKFK